MRFFYPHEPEALQRPRLGAHGVYSKQGKQQQAQKWWFAQQMREEGYKQAPSAAIYASLTFRHAMPQSWSQKKRNELVGTPYIQTPDIDNCMKYYFDVLNGIAYPDDKLIASVGSSQIYSDKPGVEIQIHSLGGDMIREYAKTVQWEIHLADLNELVKKANKLGAAGRLIKTVQCEEDSNGNHIYFEVQPETHSLPQGVPLC